MDKISNKAWRMELFYKTSKELRDKNLPFLKEYGIHRLNLTNKVVTAGDIWPWAYLCFPPALWRCAGEWVAAV